MKDTQLKPRDVDVSDGLIRIQTVHIVARSVARSIVELCQKENKWGAFTLPELTTSPSCHESPALVQIMLVELESKGFLIRKGGTYNITEEFVLWCEKQSKGREKQQQ